MAENIDVGSSFARMMGDPQTADSIRAGFFNRDFSNNLAKPLKGRSLMVTAPPAGVITNAILHLSPQITELNGIGAQGLRNYESVSLLFNAVLGVIGDKLMQVESEQSLRPERIIAIRPRVKTADDTADYIIARVVEPPDFHRDLEEVQGKIEARLARAIANIIAPQQIHDQLVATGFPVSFDYRNNDLKEKVDRAVMDELLRLSSGVQNPDMDHYYVENGLSCILPQPYGGDRDKLLYNAAAGLSEPTYWDKVYAGFYTMHAMLKLSDSMHRAKTERNFNMQEEEAVLHDVLDRAASLVTVVGFPIDSSTLHPARYNEGRISLFPQSAGSIDGIVNIIESQSGATGVASLLKGLTASDIDFGHLARNTGSLLGLARGDFSVRRLWGK